MPLGIVVEGLGPLEARLTGLAAAVRLVAGKREAVAIGAPYAKFVVEGTPPHTILPHAKQALMWPGALHPVRVVHHPGTAPNPFPYEALAAATPAVVARMELGLARAMETGAAEQLLAAFDGSAELVADEMRRRAPVRAGPGGGTLRDSIHAELG